MRLLLVTDTYPPDINGVARTLSMLAEGLDARGHAVSIVTTLDALESRGNHNAQTNGDATANGNGNGNTNGHRAALSREVVSSMPLPGYPGLRIGFASTRQMTELLTAGRPDVLYVATETPLGIAAIRAAGKLGIPVVSGFHTNFQSYLEDYHLPGLEAVAQGLLRSIHNQTARTLTPSIDTARMLEGWGIKNVGVMGRGVDTQLFNPSYRSAELRASWGADEKTPVAIYVGRMAAEKNLPLTARAFAAFQEGNPGARCVFVGDGPRLKAMQAEFPEFHYAGMRTGDDLAAHYASGDVFVFPSITETFGNVVLEAMASGLIPVAFDYAAPRLVIQEEVNGWLAPFDDEAAFLSQVRMAAPRAQDAGMREAARQTALDFSWKRVIEQFEGELLTASGQTARSAEQPPEPIPS